VIAEQPVVFCGDGFAGPGRG